MQSRVVMEDGRRIQGMARWGQFLDRDGHVKPALRQVFLGNLEQLNTDRLWQAFPLPSFRVSAPIGLFYSHY
jgi:hypothetical protein